MQQVGQPIIPDNLFLQEEYLLNDVGSERGCLACIVKQPQLIIEAERVLSPEVFSYGLHKYVYQIMLFMWTESSKHGWPIHFDAMSMLAVAKYLGPACEQAFLSKTEGMEQIRSIEALTPMVEASQFFQYVHVVKDRWNRRRLYQQSREIQKQVLNFQQFPSAQLIAVTQESEYAKIAFDNGVGSERGMRLIGDEGPEFLAKCRMAYHYKHENLFNVPCGLFPYLMALMNGGWRRKGLILVCARPKVGKSTWLLNVAIDAAVRQMIPTLYLDTEMSGEEQFSRALSNVAMVNEFQILQGKFCADGVQRTAVEGGLAMLNKAPFVYVNIAGKTIDYVQSIMRQFRNQYVGSKQYTDPQTGKVYTFSNQGLVIYDWLKLPDPGSLKSAQEYQLLGFQASAIKDAANELDLPVVAGAQNNRGAIGVTAEEWENNAEAFVAGSDRLAQFCSSLCILRNITPQEGEHILQSLPTRVGKQGSAALAYNQALHVVLQRQGPDFRRGIPMYIDRGYARYEEMATPEIISWMDEHLGKKLAKMKTTRNAPPLLPPNQAQQASWTDSEIRPEEPSLAPTGVAA